MNYWMSQTWPDYVGNDKHDVKINQKYSIVAQSKRTNGEENLLNKGDIIFFYETKTRPIAYDYEVLFLWDDVVSGIVNDKLNVFLNRYFNIDFTKKFMIGKNKEKNIITISDGGNSITLKLNLLTRPPNGKEVEASLTIGDRWTIKCWASNEDNKIILYDFNHSSSRVSKKGRGGIFAIACADSRFRKHTWSDDIYEDADRNWDLEADTEITHTGGFVPREKLCTIMGYKQNFLFHGWGIRRVKPHIAPRILECYNSQKAPC